jgi:hypothetical protein
MKLKHKVLDNVIFLPQQKKKSNTFKNIIQLVIMFVFLNIANKITIDIWRSLTGH